MMDDVTPGATGQAAENLSELQQEKDELQDRLLRTAAEFDNYRKRTDKERRELSRVVAADVVREILPVLDDLERALAATPGGGQGNDAVSALHKGVELVHRQLLDVLRKRGVEPFDVVGDDFDPEWHEAVANEPLDGHRDGEITAELRRGYKIGDRLLRPAMVRVAKS